MSNFSKNYYSPKNRSEYLSVIWEIGYRNVQIYHKERLVHTIPSPDSLMEGILIEDEELGKISVIFTIERPRKLEIKVNRKKYKTVNKIKLGYDFGGLIAVFTSLAVFAVMGTALLLGFTGFNLENPTVLVVFIFDLVLIATYGSTAYLFKKKKAWAYFIGGGLFLATTLFSTVFPSFVLSRIGNMIILVFRYGILIYIVFQGKHIANEIKRQQELATNPPNDELLDN